MGFLGKCDCGTTLTRAPQIVRGSLPRMSTRHLVHGIPLKRMTLILAFEPGLQDSHGFRRKNLWQCGCLNQKKEAHQATNHYMREGSASRKEPYGKETQKSQNGWRQTQVS